MKLRGSLLDQAKGGGLIDKVRLEVSRITFSCFNFLAGILSWVVSLILVADYPYAHLPG